ncbi:hypothetical protein CC78DRAFT_563710 [Lojkania enalia]|uniref:Alpha/beta-hydrolase n=1 Tax=Lojkania enalia TaxID=147567 RepID=A0A9P4TRP8_9PLEO|nr:hypothetical protein CC78DRAFT_563710 [Didymosphaeria enalia]
MVEFNPMLKKSYYALAGIGGIWATFLILLMNGWVQRHALYAHKVHSGFWHNVSNPEQFGFAKGQVQPFHLETTDGETLFCWHVLPMDVYTEHENELVQKAGVVVEDLRGTVGYTLLKGDGESKVVVNFHGNAGHLAQGHRPSAYRSIASIPKTHLLTCDYRGFGYSTLRNAPHIPTESGLITDGISIVSHILTTLSHPSSRTLLLGQSLGTAVTAASALYFTDSESSLLPADIVSPQGVKAPYEFAGVVLISPFPSLPILIQTYKIRGIIPLLSPLRGYPRIGDFLASKCLDVWPTLARLQALLTEAGEKKLGLRLSLLHARNDQDIPYHSSESMYAALEGLVLASEGALSSEERRTIHGGERVRRGAFAYRRVEDGEAASGNWKGGRSVELEIVRYGGHNEVVGWSQVQLCVRRAFREAEGSRKGAVGLDVE